MLLNTLDNMEVLVSKNPWLPPDTQDRLDKARKHVLSAPTAALDGIAQSLKNRLKMIETSTDQIAVLSALGSEDSTQSQNFEMSSESTMSNQDGSDYLEYKSGDLPEPSYPPDYPWEFNWDNIGLPIGGSSAGGSFGNCGANGYSLETRFITLNTAIIAEATKDIAEQFCGEVVVVLGGGNASVVCVVTDVVAYIAIGINENQELCNDFITAAEVTANWGGIKTVHENLRYAYEDLDSDLATHDSEIKTLLSELLQNQQSIMGDLQTVIELLNTPSGRRPEWNNN